MTCFRHEDGGRHVQDHKHITDLYNKLALWLNHFRDGITFHLCEAVQAGDKQQQKAITLEVQVRIRHIQ